MLLENLYNINNLSSRAYNVCRYNDITSVQELIQFYETKGSFLSLRSCGKESNNELIQIKDKYFHLYSEKLSSEINSAQEKSIGVIIQSLDDNKRDIIEKFINKKIDELTVRGRNSLRNHLNGELNLTAFWIKILSNRNFNYSIIKNAGRKTIEEITKFIENLKDFIYQTDETDLPSIRFSINPLEKALSELSPLQAETIDNQIKLKLKNLSNRSRNALNMHFNGKVSIGSMIKAGIFDNDFQLSKIKNIGNKSIKELQLFIIDLNEYLNKISNTPDTDLHKLNTALFYANEYNIDNVPDEILLSKSYFKTVNFLISEGLVLNPKLWHILSTTVLMHKNQKIYSTSEVSNQLNLTYERVRQLKSVCIEKLLKELDVLENMKFDTHLEEIIEHKDALIYVDNSFCKLINNKSGTNFTPALSTILLSKYFEKSHELIGEISDVVFEKEINHHNRHEWSTLYLINQNLTRHLNYTEVMNSVAEKANARITNTFKVSIEELCFKFIKSFNPNVREKIHNTLLFIIKNELGLKVNTKREIVFERTTRKKVHEFAFKALEELDKPSKVSVIHNKVMELFPDFNKPIESIRASMSRDNGFVPIGRKSVFGLKKWEDEKIDFKGGTIREIVEVFLKEEDYPKHIKEITKHVLKYRPNSNQNSIWTNLKLDESGEFCFFKGAMVGLTDKGYDLEYNLAEPAKHIERLTWLESFENLENFIKINDHLPSSSNCPQSEQKLYRWLNVQLGKIRLDKLNPTKTSMLKNVLNNYESELTKRERYEYNLNDLYSFVISNNRLPSPSLDDEKRLYGYYYKQKKLYQKKKLNKHQLALYSLIMAELNDSQLSLF